MKGVEKCSADCKKAMSVTSLSCVFKRHNCGLNFPAVTAAVDVACHFPTCHGHMNFEFIKDSCIVFAPVVRCGQLHILSTLNLQLQL